MQAIRRDPCEHCRMLPEGWPFEQRLDNNAPLEENHTVAEIVTLVTG